MFSLAHVLKSFHQVVAAAASVQQHMKVVCYEMVKLSLILFYIKTPAPAHILSATAFAQSEQRSGGAARERERKRHNV